MNATLRELNARKSVRAFTEEPISLEIKEAILEAAFQAPTAGAQMLYSILDITDPKIKETLAVTCDHQPFIAKAPMVLIFLADTRRWLDAYHFAGAMAQPPQVGDLLLACQDAVIAAQNAVVAAHALGVGSCYIGDILEQREKHMALFHLDPFTVPISMLIFGYPTQSQIERTKPKRFDKKYIVHQNQYRRLSEQEHRAMLKERSGQVDFNFESYIQRFCERKYTSDFAKELNRSAEGYIKHFLERK